MSHISLIHAALAVAAVVVLVGYIKAEKDAARVREYADKLAEK